MRYVAHPYQNDIQAFVSVTPRCCVFADMGAGKTAPVLTALSFLNQIKRHISPVLVLAPERVARHSWPEECLKWDHLCKAVEVTPVLGTAADRVAALRRIFRPADGRLRVATMNYENIPWLTTIFPREKWPFHVIVADEVTRLKSFRLRQGGARASALRNVINPATDRFIGLTGTPSSNGLKDLWGQLWFVDQGARLGRTYTAFLERWFYRGYDGYSVKPHAHAAAEIQEKISDVCLVVRLDSDKPIVHDVRVDLPPENMKQYRKFEHDLLVNLSTGNGFSEIVAPNAAAKTTKCLQMANGAVYPEVGSEQFIETHRVKLDALQSIQEEANGTPLLVAYHFRSDLARLRKEFPKGRILSSGDPKTIADWNAGKIPILFIHPASAGHGLNLQYGGNILVFFGFWWDLEQYLQVIERIGPARQKQAGFCRPTLVYRIIARGTLDEVVVKRHETKKSVQDLLLDRIREIRENGR